VAKVWVYSDAFFVSSIVQERKRKISAKINLKAKYLDLIDQFISTAAGEIDSTANWHYSHKAL